MRLSKMRSCETDSQGFISAQFLVLMVFTIVILSGLVNIFSVEYSRQAIYSAVNEAARAGTQSVDFRRLIEAQRQGDAGAAIELQEAENICVQRLMDTVDELLGDFVTPTTDDIGCEVVESDDGERYSMRATFNGEPLIIVPWIKPFNGRLKEITSTYDQRQAAQ